MSDNNYGGIKPKRGFRPPQPSEIEDYELAYDVSGNALYTQVNGNIVKIMGRSHFVYIRYAPNGTPTDGEMTIDSTETTTHMGISISQSPVAPTTASSYSWSKIAGAQGPQGVPGSRNHEVLIESSSPLFYKGATYSTTLTARILYGGEDVTNDPTVFASQFNWRRKSAAGTTADNTWATQKGKNKKSISITQADLDGVTTFYLDFMTDAGSSGTLLTSQLTIVEILDGEDGEDGKDGTDGTDGRGIVSTVVDYVKSTTATMPSTGWSTTRPTVNKGEYLWTRTTINYTSGSPSVSISNSYVPTDGQNGTSSYLWVRYSQNADGEDMTDDPTDAEYIGVATTSTPTAPTNHTLYTWSLIKGQDGVQGETGQDGKTSYLHIKYSNDGGTTFTSNNGETVGDWIGTYVDFIEEDSTSVSSYTWNKIKGEKGPKGDPGEDAIDPVTIIIDKTEVLVATDITDRTRYAQTVDIPIYALRGNTRVATTNLTTSVTSGTPGSFSYTNATTSADGRVRWTVPNNITIGASSGVITITLKVGSATYERKVRWMRNHVSLENILDGANQEINAITGAHAYIEPGEGFISIDKATEYASKERVRIKGGNITLDTKAANTNEEWSSKTLIQNGFLAVNAIAANSITANKLAADVGQSLDLSSNVAITSRVTKEEILTDPDIQESLKGEAGPPGIQGDKGDKGDKGDPGQDVDPAVLQLIEDTIDEIKSTGHITPAEKQHLLIKLAEIVEEKQVYSASELATESDKWGDYNSESTALITYLQGIVANTEATTDVDPTEFKAKFDTHFAALEALKKAIEAQQKESLRELTRRITDAELKVTVDSILQIVRSSEEFKTVAAAETDGDELRAQITQILERSSTFETNLDGFIAETTQKLTENAAVVEEITNYLRFEDGVLKLGNSLESMYLKQTNRRISFMDGDAERMFLSDDELNVNSINIKKAVIGRYEFIEDDTKFGGFYNG